MQIWLADKAFEGMSKSLGCGHAGVEVLHAGIWVKPASASASKSLLTREARADTLVGGTGKDLIYGGVDKDCDLFVFKSAGESGLRTKVDVIYDFESSVDLIYLTVIDANATNSNAGDSAFLFSNTTAAVFSVWYTKSGHDFIVHADVTGDAKADFQIRLAETTTLTVYDFLL